MDEKDLEILKLWKEVDSFGPLHILVADHNIEDGHLLFCLLEYLKYIPDVYNALEVQLIAKLDALPLKDRRRIAKKSYGLISGELKI